MPIVTIHAAPPSDLSHVAKMISDIRTAGANALECDVGNIWVMFQPEWLEHNSQSASDHPPVVYIKANRGRTRNKKSLFVRAITEAVGTALSITPNKVWVHYQELDPTDIWFDGHWSA